jgi:hypothetical protein
VKHILPCDKILRCFHIYEELPLVTFEVECTVKRKKNISENVLDKWHGQYQVEIKGCQSAGKFRSTSQGTVVN